MISARTLLLFVVRLIIIDALLIAPWPGSGPAYRGAFTGAGNLILGSWGADRTVRFTAMTPPADQLDVEITMRNQRTGTRGIMPISTRQFGVMPAAFLVALTLATPIPWRRRARALLWGFGCISLLAGARVIIAMLVNFSGTQPPGPMSLPAWIRVILTHLDAVLSVPLIGWFVLPLAVWIAVTIRLRDWAGQLAKSRR